MNLDKRKQLILAAIVEEFIANGEPVGSRAVAAKLDMAVSSATIRNEMAALTEMQLIEQPHTSAGRIPSHLGYRYYIDHLMNKKPLTSRERGKIDDVLVGVEDDIEKLLETASNALAFITNCASVTTTPMAKACVFCRIEIIPVAKRVVILLFMTTAGGVRNKMCRLDIEPSPEAYESFVHMANDILAHTPIEEITPAFIQTLGVRAGENALVLSPVLYGIYTLASELSGGQLILEGQHNLLAHKELAENAKTVMDFLDQEDILKKMLASPSDTVSVIMGPEMSLEVIPQIGLIVSKYQLNGQTAGSVGIIGPARLDYAKMIPYIEYFAKSMGKLLTDALHDED